LETKVAPSSTKKVFLVRFDRPTLPGFVQTPTGFGPESIELLTPEGALVTVPYTETKAVCFVRDWEPGETWRDHRSFAARPKSPGLWVRLMFRDGDSVEGMLANNLMLMEPAGFRVIPPDPTFQNQRIFVPRAALSDAQVLGVIGSPLRRRPAKRPQPEKGEQLEMFDESA
jgi:hypothetical protein